MSLFVATYTHPDANGWQTHLAAHVQWLVARVKEGTLRASGPFVGTPEKTAMLILQVPDARAANALLATDPFVVEKLVSNLTVTEWNPIFGDYNAHSTHAGATHPAA